MVYTPRLAQERAEIHRTHRGRTKRLKTDILRDYVVSHLILGWSPEQIAATSEEETGFSISHEAIYQYVYAQIYRQGYGYVKPGSIDLRPYLARHRKRRMKKGQRRPYRIDKGPLPSIEQRPKEVEMRQTIGHWEDDSIVSKASAVSLRTMNERVSEVIFISKVSDRTMKEANRVSLTRLGILPPPLRKTLTRDRGSENMGHETLERHLGGLRCYFAHPYHSWERGSNENGNGLIRRFFPKGTDFRTITEEEIRRVEYLLNTRPRKRLGWKTPYEVIYELTGVALES